MGHQPRPSGAPNGWLHNAMPCSCLLIPAFLTACHLTTIWAEDIILRHPLAWSRERKSPYLFASDGGLVRRGHRRSCCGWPVATPRTGEGSGDQGQRWRARLQVSWAQDRRAACWPGAQKPNMRESSPDSHRGDIGAYRRISRVLLGRAFTVYNGLPCRVCGEGCLASGGPRAEAGAANPPGPRTPPGTDGVLVAAACQGTRVLFMLTRGARLSAAARPPVLGSVPGQRPVQRPTCRVPLPPGPGPGTAQVGLRRAVVAESRLAA